MSNPSAHSTYSFADIERYLSGGMTAKEMHDLERAALQDPFLADAIEGYQNADKNIAHKHLDEITAALQKKEPAKVILMPEKKRYRWLVAASLLAVIGTGVFLFVQRNQSSKQLAMNEVKSVSQKDSVLYNIQPATPERDSETTIVSDNRAVAKRNNGEEFAKSTLSQTKKPATNNEDAAKSSPQPDEAPRTAMTYASPQESAGRVMNQKQLSPVVTDSSPQGAISSEVVVSAYGVQRTKRATTWTTDKDKPFLLSDVEVINIGKKKGKKSDTSAIKPEGGWQLFQNYLFSRLSYQDSLLVVDDNRISGDLELEFTVDKTGSPYDVKVLTTQDSTIANKIADAIRSGPKWKGSDNKEKRLRLRY